MYSGKPVEEAVLFRRPQEGWGMLREAPWKGSLDSQVKMFFAGIVCALGRVITPGRHRILWKWDAPVLQRLKRQIRRV